MVSESIIANQAIMSKFIGKKYLFCTNYEIHEYITLSKCPAIRYL